MAYPFLVTLADDILATLIREWQRAPYRFAKELDFHVGLASRIDTVLRLLGRDSVLGNYTGAPPGFETNQRWSRVAAAPTVMVHDGSERKANVMPDVVIWHNAEDPNEPPDARDNEVRSNWPMAWACELKLNDTKATGWDGEKMRRLIGAGDLGYGAVVELTRWPIGRKSVEIPAGARPSTRQALCWYEDPGCKHLWHWKA